MEEVFAEMPILGEIAERQGVKADLAGMSVQIEHEQGRFSGDIEVEARIKAKIRGNCLMANGETRGTIQLVSLDVDEEGRLIARIALKAFNVREMVRKALSDPNSTLKMVLGPQLKQRGIELKCAQLQFKDKTPAVLLWGEPPFFVRDSA